ncbi:hypothetical protein SGCOL_003451 [Colletotrichum sp. CLE4]
MASKSSSSSHRESPDPIGIFLGSQQYATYGGNRITAVSELLQDPIEKTPPNSVTSYPGSSPPLLVGITASGAQTMVFAICDSGDNNYDSALMLNAAGCVNCDSVAKIDYVTITSIVAAGQEYTSTVKASGTVSGTFFIQYFCHTYYNINNTVKYHHESKSNRFNNIAEFNPINFGSFDHNKLTFNDGVHIRYIFFKVSHDE